MQNVVYAVVIVDTVVYVGETMKGMGERFLSYRYGNPLRRDTDNRVKERITESLQRGETVNVWATQPFAEVTLPTGKHNIPASKPIEELLIATLRPELNAKNIGRSTTPDLVKHPKRTPINGLAIASEENRMPTISQRDFAVRLVNKELIRMGYKITANDTATADITAEYNGKKYAIFVRFRHFRTGPNESEMDVIKNDDIAKSTTAAAASQRIPTLAYVANLSTRTSTHLFLTSFDHIQTDPKRFKKVKNGYGLYFSAKRIGQYVDDPMLTYRFWNDDNLEQLCEQTIL